MRYAVPDVLIPGGRRREVHNGPSASRRPFDRSRPVNTVQMIQRGMRRRHPRIGCHDESGVGLATHQQIHCGERF